MNIDWRELKVFEGIDLNDSFILDWQSSEGRLLFSIEASIWPYSQHYEKPKENEYTCYKRAQLSFTNCKSVNGLKEVAHASSSTDLNGTVDYGNIETLTKTDTGFHLSGEFGNVQIQGGQLDLTIHV